MKLTAHVPTEQYGFVEAEWDSTEGLSAKEVYDEVKKQFQPQLGLDTKAFNAALDEYLQTNNFTNADETYFKMSPEQQRIIQEIKKSVKRIEAKQ